jgi:hypothetical protein
MAPSALARIIHEILVDKGQSSSTPLFGCMTASCGVLPRTRNISPIFQ